MDGKRFDDLSRALVQGRTRRGVLKGLAGGIAAGVAALTGRGGVDAQRLPNGSACTRATNCTSLKCVDGVCCDANCTGQCESCATGTCLPVTGAVVGNRPPCTGTGVCQATCDGVTRNQCTLYPGLDVSCAPGTCEDGFGTIYGCGGDGTCHPLTESCGLYVCNPGGTACLTTCASDRDCVGEAFCLNGACVEDRPLGDPCTADAQCASGICAQGVCCVESCPGGCRVCNLAGNLGFCTEIPDGGACDGGTCCDGECVNTQTNLEHCGACDNACRLVPTPGTCEDDPICQAGVCTFTPLPAGTVCRASAGICDPAEVCNGTAITCPPNAFAPPTQVCRASAGACDPAEFCPGTGPLCPADALAPAGTVCRPAAGPCDVAEVCSGTSPTCPVDGFASAETVCRPAAGPCDVAETCTGSSAACPPDGFAPGGTVCRPAAGPCDVAEVCSGTSAACPPDGFAPGGTVCRAAGANAVCDPAEVCSGTSGTCPPPAFAPPGTPCNDGIASTINDQCNGQGQCIGTPAPIDMRAVGGGDLFVDDDLELYVNGNLVFSEHDGFVTTYPPFDLNLNNGDVLRVVAFNGMQPCATIGPFELFRAADGAVQVLDAVGFPTECGVGAGLVIGVFYDETFVVNMP